MTHPVLWFEVMGNDGDALRQFYGRLFGWQFRLEGPQGYGVTQPGAPRGIPGGVGQAADGYRPWGVTFYVETPDVAASLAEAERLGGRTVMPRTVMPGATLGLFRDPEGHVVGLVEPGAA
jgi:predicted enzyme related to lactoylglutathione lyase